MKVSDYIEISKIKKERFDNELDRSLSMLSIYLDEDIEEIENKPVLEVNRFIIEMNDFLSKEHEGLNSIPNTKATLGDFIALETYLTNPDDLPKCIAILFRQSKQNEWGHVIYEPVEFDIDERANTYIEQPIESYLNGLNKYVEFRQYIIDQYKSIFGLDDIEEEIETDGLNAGEIKEIEEAEIKRKAKEQYSWENFIYWLAGEDLTKVDSVLKFPILYALNMASMKKVYES